MQAWSAVIEEREGVEPPDEGSEGGGGSLER